MASSLSDSALDALVERLTEDMTRRWRQGEQPLAEEYLGQHPQLLDEPEAATELIYEEICLRQEHGEGAATTDVLQHFPQWRAQLQVVLDCHQLMQAEAASPRFPAVGESLGEFRLVAELGRGAQGRVFLATQPDLADRPVVLKLVPLLGREHLSLARLQHTHIVPLYSVQGFPGALARALCLPYFGGLTLSSLLEALRGVAPERRTGRLLLDAIRQAQRTSPVSISVSRHVYAFLAGSSYIQAVCWIGAGLADALQYAHERGVLHLDLKPANVLLAADGQPMLLDFHLARGPIAAGTQPPAWLGGTPAYMAPEQRLAAGAVKAGCPIPVAVENRADLYALGLVLYELLGGELPLPAEGVSSALLRFNASVTPGLADVLTKCLANNPLDRYPSAAALAGDLRRHLSDLPLQGVANRSLRERWRKWRRRRPYAPLLAALLLFLIAGGLLGSYQVQRQVSQARDALNEGRELLQRREYEEASGAFKRGLALADGMPFSDELTRTLRSQLSDVEGIEAARELHAFVERVRILAGGDAATSAEGRAVEAHCRVFWQQRERIVALLEPLDSTREQLHDDLLDLALLWSGLRVRMASRTEIAARHQEALDVLAEAERLCGPSCALCLERGKHAAALGMTELAQEAARQGGALSPRTAWEHLALGRSLFQAGDVAGAADHFDRALDIQPQDLWANFHKGRCAYQLGRHEDAVAAFCVCIALAPESGWCYYNRGLALAEHGRLDRALRDFDRSLQLDPKLAAAALNRGLLHYREKRYAAALADLQRALRDEANPAATHHGLALVHVARGDRTAALAALHEALRHDPEHKEARALSERLQSEPAGARPPL